MGISKKIGEKGNFSKVQPATKKDILDYAKIIPQKFTQLIDVFQSYYQKSDTFLVINEDETGITTSTFEVTSDKHYTHTQLVLSDQWQVDHSLDKNPHVIVLDEANRKIHGEVIYIDNNNLMVKFENAISGKVFCN